MAKTAVEKLAELEKQAEALRAKVQAIKVREREAGRKADTRRKVILSGELLARASRDERWSGIVAELLAGIKRPADISAFNGWTPPSPSVVPITDAAPQSVPTGAELLAVAFPERPAVEVTAALKAKGFRWNPDRHRWEGTAAMDETRQIAEAAGGQVSRISPATEISSSTSGQ